MKRVLMWIWSRGILGTFLTGLFVLLPVVITVAIMGWAGGKLGQLVGDGSVVGDGLHRIGLQVVGNERVASIVGWVFVLTFIWLIGLLVKSTARDRVSEGLQSLANRIPVLGSIYNTVAQVLGMLKGEDKADLKTMAVVFCHFGQDRGGGFLGLLPSPKVYLFGGQKCNVVYIPTSPVPMSGAIVFVPVEAVEMVAMEVEDLMKIYFSLGVLAGEVVPSQYRPST